MMKIALGTSNPHKLEEINDILKHICPDCIEFVLVDGDFDPVENGTTFEENSYIKAREAAKVMKIPALADDTGLCVDALDGRPGLYSARYAPDQKSKIEKLLGELKNVPDKKRTALMKSLDRINTIHGRHTIHYAVEGLGEQDWHMKQKNKSPRRTTDWKELAVASCKL